MKYIFYLLILLFPIFGSSQIEDPVSWSFDVEDLGDGEYRLNVNAEIEEGWHIYSQYKSPESFIIATAFYFEETKGIDFIDASSEKVDYPLDGFRLFLKESNPIEKFVPIQDEFAKYFEKNAQFSQLVKVNSTVSYIKGQCEFMVCDDEQCLPPDIFDFEFCLYGDDCLEKKKDEPGSINQVIDKDKEKGSSIYKREIDYNSYQEELKKKLEKGEITESEYNKFKISEEENESKGSVFSQLLQSLLAGIIGGLIALITPCVFPMIPLTVSYFLKGSEKRKKAIFNAFLYGFFIVFIYFLFSLPFHFFSIDPGSLNQIATNAWVNIIFFFVFIVFAISFFGYFEIRLPSKWVNKVDSASNIGGILGIFFMALTLALVSFSCTGPVLGTALAKTGLSSSSSTFFAAQLSVTMIGFGLSLGVPFALFALFPSWLKSLPKSGSWMNTFKVFIGFLEVALAIKFLSNADAVYELRFILREVFFILWAITFFGLSLYLIGGIYFPHDNRTQKVGYLRFSFGLIVLAFVIYLIPGATCLQNGPNYSLFGLPPPKTYSYCLCDDDSFDFDDARTDSINDNVKLKDNIKTKDYFQALQLSNQYRKPILVDFTGMACVNCRKLEDNVWSNKSIDSIIKKDYILAQLYVDKRKSVPLEVINKLDQYGYIIGSKEINTIGDKWMTLQEQTFVKNTQPLHVILMPCSEGDAIYNEKILGPVLAYKDANNVDYYFEWLLKGVENYKEFSK